MINVGISKKKSIENLTRQLQSLKVSPDTANNTLKRLNTSGIREKISITQLLKRPQLGLNDIKTLHPDLDQFLGQFDDEVQQQAEINIKYDTYIQREQDLVLKLGNLDNLQIRTDFDYDRVKALSIESREKLKRIKPTTIGQASRISGVSPADLSVLTIYMGK